MHFDLLLLLSSPPFYSVVFLHAVASRYIVIVWQIATNTPLEQDTIGMNPKKIAASLIVLG